VRIAGTFTDESNIFVIPSGTEVVFIRAPIRYASYVLLFGVLVLVPPMTRAQEKTVVAPYGSDIHVEIEPTVTTEGGYRVPPLRLLSSPDPVFPKAGITGTVVLRCVVGIDGRVHEPVVVQSLSPGNDSSALKAVRAWKFLPAERNGKKVAVKTTLVVIF